MSLTPNELLRNFLRKGAKVPVNDMEICDGSAKAMASGDGFQSNRACKQPAMTCIFTQGFHPPQKTFGAGTVRINP